LPDHPLEVTAVTWALQSALVCRAGPDADTIFSRGNSTTATAAAAAAAGDGGGGGGGS